MDSSSIISSSCSSSRSSRSISWPIEHHERGESEKIFLSSEEIRYFDQKSEQTFIICKGNDQEIDELRKKSEKFMAVYLGVKMSPSLIEVIPKNICRAILGAAVTTQMVKALPRQIQIIKILTEVSAEAAAALPESVHAVIIEGGVSAEVVKALPAHVKEVGIEGSTINTTEENLLREKFSEIIAAISPDKAVKHMGYENVSLLKTCDISVPKAEKQITQGLDNFIHIAIKDQEKDFKAPRVIDEVLFPRCEFYRRFENTSVFPNDINRAHTYTRSEDARYAQGNKDEVKFVPTPITVPKELNPIKNSLSAHAGGFANPYVLPTYSEKIKLEKYKFNSKYLIEPKLYDELLTYKLRLCDHIVTDFNKKLPHADLGGSKYHAKIFTEMPTIKDFKDTEIIIYKYKSRGSKVFNVADLYCVIDGKLTLIDLSHSGGLDRELTNIKAVKEGANNQALEELLKKFQPYLISKRLYPKCDEVYFSNKYPCVLVKFTPRVSDKSVSSGELKTFYKRYNHLLMAYFIAIVDHNAYKAGIEIEMVGRSGFGQNNPSIAITDRSFRINIGLVPTAYADIVVKSLVELHNLFHLLENTERHSHLNMDEKLREKLNEARKKGFDNPELPFTYWEALWVKGSHGKAGRIMLCELIEREPDRADLLANFVLNAITSSPDDFFNRPDLAETPLAQMFELIDYTDSKISVKSKQTLESQKNYTIDKISNRKVSDDFDLYTIIAKLCNNFAVDLPKDLKIREMYQFLEASHIDFICEKRTRTLSNLNKVSDWGSDSETEEPNFVKVKSIFAKKVIVANGMLAINLSYYAARSAIYFLEAIKEMADDDDVDTLFENHRDEMELCSRKISINCNNTYFETISCLNAASNPPVQVKDSKADVLFFDINSFNSDSIAEKADLIEQLGIAKPMVVVLDHTSSTTIEIRRAIKKVYKFHPWVYMVLLVSSGLKNEQGGGDNNPYGKLTIMSLADEGEKNTLTNFIYDEITALTSTDTDVKLNKKALLPKAAHAIRQSYKDRGFSTTAYLILHDDLTDMGDESSSNDGIDNTDNVIYFQTLRDIKNSYPGEFENLVDVGCSNKEIYDLYRASYNKFIALADDKVLNLIKNCEDFDLFDELSSIYDTDKICFRDIVNDEDDLILTHGIEEVRNTYRQLVERYAHENSDGEHNDIINMVDAELNGWGDELENSSSDNEGSGIEYDFNRNYSDSYTTTSSSEEA